MVCARRFQHRSTPAWQDRSLRPGAAYRLVENSRHQCPLACCPVWTGSAYCPEPGSPAESGERGIRTPGTLRYSGFQDRRNRPLCHLSDRRQRYAGRQMPRPENRSAARGVIFEREPDRPVHSGLFWPHRPRGAVGPVARTRTCTAWGHTRQHRLRHHGPEQRAVLQSADRRRLHRGLPRHGVAGWEFSTGHSAVWLGAFVLTDFAYYWAHRLSHEVNLLWIGHSVHHQSEDYNLGVALRQSVLQKVLLIWVYWPLAMLGFPPEMFLTSMAINLLYQFWIHTELIDRMGPLEWVLNTPSHHRVHHGRNPEYIDRNHAGVFIIWDRMFGTFQEEIVKPTYGVTRPTDSFNPVYAQWKPVADLWRDLRAIPGWLDRVRFLSPHLDGIRTAWADHNRLPTSQGRRSNSIQDHPMPWPWRFCCFVGCCSWPLLLEHCNPLKPARLKPWPSCWAGVFCALAATGELWNKGWGVGASPFRRGCRCGLRPGGRGLLVGGRAGAICPKWPWPRCLQS